LIAHSFGGVIAINYAKRYPRHVSSIVLSNVTLHFLSRDTLRMQIGMLNRLVDAPIAMPPPFASIEALRMARDEVRSKVNRAGRGYLQFTSDPSTLRRMVEVDGGYERSQGFGAAVMARPAQYPEYFADYIPLTEEIDAPVLIIAGSADYAVGPAHHRRFRFRHAQTVMLKSGHMPYADASHEFVAAVRRFLECVAASNGRARTSNRR
jgi:proline iminopeptidase